MQRIRLRKSNRMPENSHILKNIFENIWFFFLKVFYKHWRLFCHRLTFSCFITLLFVLFLFPMRFHGDKSSSTLKSTPLKSTRNPWSASTNSIFLIRSNLPRRGFLVIGYLWLSLRGLTVVHRIHPRKRSPPNLCRIEQDGRARRHEREKEKGREWRRERSRKEAETQADPARGGHMKIFLGMPKTETRAGALSSSFSKRDAGGSLCDIGDRRHFAVTASRSASFFLLLPSSFSPLFIVYSVSRADTANLYFVLGVRI